MHGGLKMEAAAVVGLGRRQQQRRVGGGDSGSGWLEVEAATMEV